MSKVSTESGQAHPLNAYPNGPGTQITSLSASWAQGCVPDGAGHWKFDAAVMGQIDVRLGRLGDRASLGDGNACTILEHENKHVKDFVDDLAGIENHFPSEGFRTPDECKVAFARFINAQNFSDFVNFITESSRSRRDPFDYAR